MEVNKTIIVDTGIIRMPGCISWTSFKFGKGIPLFNAPKKLLKKVPINRKEYSYTNSVTKNKAAFRNKRKYTSGYFSLLNEELSYLEYWVENFINNPVHSIPTSSLENRVVLFKWK